VTSSNHAGLHAMLSWNFLCQSLRTQRKWRQILCQNITGMASGPVPTGFLISTQDIISSLYYLHFYPYSHLLNSYHNHSLSSAYTISRASISLISKLFQIPPTNWFQRVKNHMRRFSPWLCWFWTCGEVEHHGCGSMYRRRLSPHGR
jgi:hypothetical protein